MLGLLQDTTLDEEQRDYVQVAMMSSEALLTVINDILDFSKIEAGSWSWSASISICEQRSRT